MVKDKIKIGIVGYGNLGKGATLAIKHHEDMELVGIFTRRNPDSISSEENFISYDDILEYKDKIDVMILCGGSAKDLDLQGPEVSKHFNTIDSFDNHGRIPEYFDKIDESSKEHSNLSLISVGWDPGLFSLNRLMAESILPQGKTYTFWGEGLSQGHSDAIRRVDGVTSGVQYTIPDEDVLEKVRCGESIQLKPCEMHKRVCFVSTDEDRPTCDIEDEIVNMPNYFADYDTTVNFTTKEDISKNHCKMKHGGYIVHSGKTGEDNVQKYEFNLSLDSNPEFTASVLVAYARAIHRLSKEGKTGAITIFDIPPIYISSLEPEVLRKTLL